MLLPTTKTTEQLDELLLIICEKLQLPTSSYDKAVEHYEAVGKWLSVPGTLLANWHPQIYSQGSIRIGTTTRPIGRDEYDIDLVCELATSFHHVSPDSVYKRVEQRLRENADYARMIELKKRCIRLNYSGQFHLDILPAVPDQPRIGTEVRIPDRKLKEWKKSDPKGYATWFKERSGQYQLALIEKAEPIPDRENADEKTPLQASVQLIKRWRDILFEDAPEQSPRSIVLTTLAGHAYEGEPTTSEALTWIIGRILNRVRYCSEPLVVQNPMTDEVLSEKWEEDPSSFFLFVRRLEHFNEQWQKVLTTEGVGLGTVTEILSSLFGEKLTASAVETYAESISRDREDGNLHIARSTGALSTAQVVGATIPVPENTFYGEDPK